jgi:hypothetical protein
VTEPTNQIHGNVYGSVIQVRAVYGDVYVGSPSPHLVATPAPPAIPAATPTKASSTRLGLRPPTTTTLTTRAADRLYARPDIPVITRVDPPRKPLDDPRRPRPVVATRIGATRGRSWEPSTLVIALFLFSMLVLFVVARAISLSY